MRRVRTVIVGVRYGEVKFPKIPDIKEGTRIRELPVLLPSRPIVSVSLGPHVRQATLFHTDPGDRDTMLAGARKRFAAKMPDINPGLADDFKRFVRNFCEERLLPLLPDHDLSFENWIEHANYPQARKDELIAVYAQFGDQALYDKKLQRVKSFMKDEGYTDVKHARGINSRSDPFKVVSGPLFHAIECVVFQLPEFIKYVPVRERAKHLFDELWEPGVTFVITDYTSFECGFVLLMMDACEFELYIFMLRHTPALMAMFIICWQVLGGENVCTFKYFVIWVFATRMSGEMCTSLGNGFSNLCLMAFACYLSGVTWKGRFEGDDGVAAVRGTINKKIFKRLGMRIKLKKGREAGGGFLLWSHF